MTDPAARRSRRAILGAIGGGLVATALGGWREHADAANGDAVTVGGSFSGTGSTAITSSGAGIIGAVAGSYTGTSSLSSGVHGKATSTSGVVYGVIGESSSASGAGTGGWSDGGTGVVGYSGHLPDLFAPPPGTGVYGQANLNADSRGVYGYSAAGAGVEGVSDSGAGVFAQSNGIAVLGISTSNTRAAVEGTSANRIAGVFGLVVDSLLTNPGPRLKTGVHGYADAGSTSEVGVWGEGVTGRGGGFSGAAAQIQLVPSTSTSHPTHGLAGDLFVDRHHRLWFCKGGTKWAKLA